MRRFGSLCMLLMLTLAVRIASGQDDSTSSTGTPSSSASGQESVPPYDQDNSPAPITENPPISGLDQPGVEPHAVPISYLQAGASVVESADSNIGDTLGGQSWQSEGRALGALTLQRVWKNYDLALDDVGGGGYYGTSDIKLRSIEQLDFDQKISWKRGQLSLRDSFSYLPEGNFGEGYGALGSQALPSLGNTAFSSFWGGSAFGALGETPRVLNLSLADVTQDLSPKSAVTAAAGYALLHFYGNDAQTGGPFIGSSEVSAQTGYSRVITSRTQMALVYGYQGFDFTVVGTDFYSNIIQVMYGHRVSGRTDFLIAAGPQFTHYTVSATVPEFTVGVAGRALLHYRFSRADLTAMYERYLTSGSGLLAGAQTNVARLSASHPITRAWNAYVDIGYASNHRLQTLSPAQLVTCSVTGTQSNLPPCPGIETSSYSYGFAGAGLHHPIGHDFNISGNYQFQQLSFSQSYCAGIQFCSHIGNRQTVSIGLEWTPRPMRID